MSVSLVVIFGLLTSCEDLTQPPAEVVTDRPLASDAQSEDPFYFYRGQPIHLAITPGPIVVSSSKSTGQARDVLDRISISVEKTEEIAHVPGHTLLHLKGAGAPETTARTAVAVLRARGFEFASPVYGTVESGDEVILLNRVAVQFKTGVTETQIDDLNRAIGTQVLHPPRPEDGYIFHMLKYPADSEPLEVAALLDRHPLVQWAHPDMVTDRRLAEVDDPFFPFQFYLKSFNEFNGIRVDINIEPVWPVTTGDTTVRVAILDNGVDHLHRISTVCLNGLVRRLGRMASMMSLVARLLP